MIRLPTPVRLGDWYTAIDSLIIGLESVSISSKLWVIRANSIQEYHPLVEENNNE